VAHQPVFGHCQATIPHIAVLPVRCSPAVIQNASLCKCRSTWHFTCQHTYHAHMPCHVMPSHALLCNHLQIQCVCQQTESMLATAELIQCWTVESPW
jgi:hypothetical protein